MRRLGVRGTLLLALVAGLFPHGLSGAGSNCSLSVPWAPTRCGSG
jgi:hypothetical protein